MVGREERPLLVGGHDGRQGVVQGDAVPVGVLVHELVHPVQPGVSSAAELLSPHQHQPLAAVARVLLLLDGAVIRQADEVQAVVEVFRVGLREDRVVQ